MIQNYFLPIFYPQAALAFELQSSYLFFKEVLTFSEAFWLLFIDQPICFNMNTMFKALLSCSERFSNENPKVKETPHRHSTSGYTWSFSASSALTKKLSGRKMLSWKSLPPTPSFHICKAAVPNVMLPSQAIQSLYNCSSFVQPSVECFHWVV